MQFKLDEQLQLESDFITRLTLCQLRLHHNAAFPWLILIPERDAIVEILDLNAEEQGLLWQEVTQVATLLKKICQPHKLNIATLGNIVSQLHVHIIARFKNDAVWPQPVWNSGCYQEYLAQEKQSFTDKFLEELKT